MYNENNSPVGHLTKRGPSLILLHSQPHVAVYHREKNLSISEPSHQYHRHRTYNPGQACCGLNDGFLLLRIFSVAISVSPHVCVILDLILSSMILR